MENRKFGMEIEMSLPVSVEDWMNLSDTYKNEYGLLSYVNQHEQHGVDRGYDLHITYDGSVNNHGGQYGWEIITRPMRLSEANFIHSLKLMLLDLYRKGGKTDYSCGLHVHVDRHLLRGCHLANILMFYMTHQDVLYNLMPASREESSYANRFPDYAFAEFANRFRELGDNLDAGDVYVVFGGEFDRYQLINFEPINHGHFEIRVGIGTINPRRMFNWVELQLSIVKFVAESADTLNIDKLASYPSDIENFLDGFNLTERLKEYYLSEYRRWGR